MWIRNQDRDVLINLNTGLRLVIIPNNKKEGEEQRYAVLVQTPTEATQPLTRSLPTGYNNTVLLSGAPYQDCLQLLDLLRYEVGGCWQVPDFPYNEDQPETCILEYVDHHKYTAHYICEDEATARWLMHNYVIDYWPKHSLDKIPPDPDEAIRMSQEQFGQPREWKIIAAPYVSRLAEKGHGK